MSVDNRIIERIQKLLALAGNNSNEHERQRAMEAASALLAEHQLSMADVQVSGSSQAEPITSESQSGIRFVWKRHLLNQVARLNYVKGYRNGDTHFLVGTPTAIAAARSIWLWLCDDLQRAARHWDSDERISFLNGATSRIAERITEMLKEERARLMEGVSGSPENRRANALVLVRDTEARRIADFLRGQGVRLVTTGSTSRSRSQAAYHAGKDHGNGVSLNRQVSGTGVKRLEAR